MTNIHPIINIAEHETARLLWVTIAPLLLLLGTPGNFLSLVVMSLRALRLKSSSLVLSFLAVVDIAALYVGLLHK